MDEIWQEQSSRALGAFAAFVESTADDDTVIDQSSGLTGAQLHIAHKTLVDMSIDYETILGSVPA